MEKDKQQMEDDSRSWWEKLGQVISGEPKNRQELLDILREARANGLLDADVLGMIEGALKVSELQVRQVMIPRAQMVAIPQQASLDEILHIIVDSGHSRFPVTGEDKDEIEGILLAKDLLKHFISPQNAFDINQYIRPAVFIPESKRVNVLLKEFRTNRNHMAIVLDEYGGVAGLVTIEDLLEEIVGDIDDEYDEEEDPFILEVKPGQFRINALTTIEDFNARFNSNFSDDEVDTIGGLIISELGRLPETGEKVRVGDYHFHIAKTDNRRLQTVELDLPAA